VRRAAARCDETNGCKYVSVWFDAGFRMYADGECDAAGLGGAIVSTYMRGDASPFPPPSLSPSPPPSASPPPPPNPSPAAGGAPPPPSTPPAVVSTFKLSGDVADFTETKKAAIKTMIATAASVAETAVTVKVMAASVTVESTITLASAADATAAKGLLSAGVLASKESLETALAADPELSTFTVVAAPTVATGDEACARPCKAYTCGDLQHGFACSYTNRLGCDCTGCCAAATASTPALPKVCGNGLEWNWDSKQCELICAA